MKYPSRRLPENSENDPGKVSKLGFSLKVQAKGHLSTMWHLCRKKQLLEAGDEHQAGKTWFPGLSFSVYSLFLYFLFLVESDSMGSLTLRERCNPRVRSLSIQGTLWFISLQMWSTFLVTFSSLFMLMTVRLPPNLRKFCRVSKTILSSAQSVFKRGSLYL